VDQAKRKQVASMSQTKLSDKRIQLQQVDRGRQCVQRKSRSVAREKFLLAAAAQREAIGQCGAVK
jgi:hypothetical protein